jgi:hypothetical protein
LETCGLNDEEFRASPKDSKASQGNPTPQTQKIDMKTQKVASRLITHTRIHKQKQPEQSKQTRYWSILFSVLFQCTQPAWLDDATRSYFREEKRRRETAHLAQERGSGRRGRVAACSGQSVKHQTNRYVLYVWTDSAKEEEEEKKVKKRGKNRQRRKMGDIRKENKHRRADPSECGRRSQSSRYSSPPAANFCNKQTQPGTTDRQTDR